MNYAAKLTATALTALTLLSPSIAAAQAPAVPTVSSAASTAAANAAGVAAQSTQSAHGTTPATRTDETIAVTFGVLLGVLMLAAIAWMTNATYRPRHNAHR